MPSITLAALISRIRDLGDYNNEDVFPDSFITEQINDAIGEFSDLLDSAFEGWRDTTLDSLVTVSGTATVALPANCLTVRGLEIRLNSRWQPLIELSLGQTYRLNVNNGEPVGYMQVGSNFELFPTPDAVYSLRLRYTPVATPLADDADEFDYPQHGWEKFIVYSALAALDDREERDISPRMMHVEAIRKRVWAAAKRRNVTGPTYIPFPGEGAGDLL